MLLPRLIEFLYREKDINICTTKLYDNIKTINTFIDDILKELIEDKNNKIKIEGNLKNAIDFYTQHKSQKFAQLQALYALIKDITIKYKDNIVKNHIVLVAKTHFKIKQFILYLL